MSAAPRAFYQVLRLHQLVSTCLEETLAPAGLTATQYTMLSVVRRLAPAPSAQLARRLQVSAQAAGETLKQLAQGGLIDRSRSDRDRRVTLIALTTKGLQVMSDADRLVTEAEARFFAALTAPERQALDLGIQRLRRAAEPRRSEAAGGVVNRRA